MCISCRCMKEKSDLLRVVKAKDTEAEIDLIGKKDGRGAYICKAETCVKRVIKNRMLNRSFKTHIQQSVYDTLEGVKMAQEIETP